MIEQYIGVEPRKIGYFLGLVTGVAVLTTVLFWLVYGFGKWKNDVQMASDLMMAAAVFPSAGPQTLQTPACTTGIAGQFVCPTHGSVGLPQYDAAGTPHCPVCGQVMVFHSPSSTNLTLAAGG